MLTMLSLYALTLSLASAEPAEGPATLVVEVGKLRNLKGLLRCQIFDKADGFPSERPKAKVKVDQTPGGNFVTCTFNDLPAGTYAVAVLHDEDQDGVLATNFLGMPQEGYGASNNKLPGMSAPTFEDSRLRIEAGERRVIKVELRY